MITAVFETSADLYRAITEFAAGTPSWFQDFAEWGTDGGLVVFAVLFLLAAWRLRRAPSRVLAPALLAPFATVGAYAISETAKSLIEEERPCRAVVGALPLAECPPVGDWSFPSNHATIAAASAGALVLAWRKLAPLVLPLAAVMALSRVFVGVHYPHDVAVGYLLGVLAAPLLALAFVPVATSLIDRFRPRLLPSPTADADTVVVGALDVTERIPRPTPPGDDATHRLPRVR
ncbi:phosphatase PAP2 family protein [Saccharothrix sp. Mg75]|uniref:phosphatase PAP2 family protein n=1 Tax=Saccharothrix sp. Mg75 TaxID=3445357 RepID=UPI003EECF7BF